MQEKYIDFKNKYLINGWILLDKPLGITSNQLLTKIKKLFFPYFIKVGHAGTLDPLASGMLPIALGKATKTIPILLNNYKIYIFQITWGVEKSTDDNEGKVLFLSTLIPNINDIYNAIPNFIGTIQQKPPRFSAIKINGKPAYSLARKNNNFTLFKRLIKIYNLCIISYTHNTTTFKIKCGKGVYIRSIARDFGRYLGTYGYISYLRRISIYPFNSKNMISLIDLYFLLKNKSYFLDYYLISIRKILNHIKEIYISSNELKKIKLGLSIPVNWITTTDSNNIAFASILGNPVAYGYINYGYSKPVKLLTL